MPKELLHKKTSIIALNWRIFILSGKNVKYVLKYVNNKVCCVDELKWFNKFGDIIYVGNEHNAYTLIKDNKDSLSDKNEMDNIIRQLDNIKFY